MTHKLNGLVVGLCVVALVVPAACAKDYSGPDGCYKLTVADTWKSEEQKSDQAHVLSFQSPGGNAEVTIIAVSAQAGSPRELYDWLVQQFRQQRGAGARTDLAAERKVGALTWVDGGGHWEENGVSWNAEASIAQSKSWLVVVMTNASEKATEAELTDLAAIRKSLTVEGGKLEGDGADQPAQGDHGAGAKPATGAHAEPVVFRRVAEPRENAFSILVPYGWEFQGGILRIMPDQMGGPANCLEAKCDMTLTDAGGTHYLKRLPDWYYADVSKMATADLIGGMFPEGSNYNGMQVRKLMSPQDYLARVVFPALHPNAQDLKVVEQREVPALVKYHEQMAAALQIPLKFDFWAAYMEADYTENGQAFTEGLYCTIEWRGPDIGQWANRDTTAFRAPAEEYTKWEPVFAMIVSSVKLSAQWIFAEAKGQRERGDIANRYQREIQELDRQIVENRQHTNAEINNDMFLTLTGQEEYVNPYTNEVEIGTNEFTNRWVTEGGDVVYAPDDNWDPNTTGVLNRIDWKRSEVRPR